MKTLLHSLRTRLRWYRQAGNIQTFIRTNDFLLEHSGKTAAVVISPWFLTYIPWFSIAVGLLLKKFYNVRIVFIVDDLPFSDDTLNPSYQTRSIVKIGKLLAGRNEVLFLSKAEETQPSEPLYPKYAYFNTVHDLKTEEFTESDPYYRLLREQLQQSERYILSAIAHLCVDYLFLPGGLCLNSGLIQAYARQQGIRVTTYDSGTSGEFLLCTDGTAAHLDDIPRTVKALDTDASLPFEAIEEDIRRLMQDRMQGIDHFKYQTGPCETADLHNSVLLPLNVNWDSAALDKHRLFTDTIDWILQTTRWILEHTDKTVIIRQHPVERFEYGKSHDDYQAILHNTFGSNPRIRFIGAADPINTYTILSQTDLVITHTSTVAAEAVILGKNVVTVSDAYYAKIGFVHTPADQAAYFALLGQLLDTMPAISPVQYHLAVLSYYASQRLNWFFPEFLPSIDIDRWITQPLDHILSLQGTAQILESIHTGTPLPIINLQQNNEFLNQGTQMTPEEIKKWHDEENEWWNKYSDIMAYQWKLNDRINTIIRSEMQKNYKSYLYKKGGCIIDIGCGTGWLALYFSQKGMSSVGIDFSEEQIKIANQLKKEKDLDNVEFICADFIKFDYTEHIAKYDSIFINAFLHHLPPKQLEEVFEIIGKISKDTASIYLYEPIMFNGERNNPIGKSLLTAYNKFLNVLIQRIPSKFKFWNNNFQTAMQSGYNGMSPNEMSIEYEILYKILEKNSLKIISLKPEHYLSISFSILAHSMRRPYRMIYEAFIPAVYLVDKIIFRIFNWKAIPTKKAFLLCSIKIVKE